MNKNLFYILGLVTLVGFSTLGSAILYFISDIALIEAFSHGIAWYKQIVYGLLVGLAIGAAAFGIIAMPFMKPVLEKYSGLMDGLHLNYFDVLFISFCAGYGEEILFRATMQHYFGIWPTAIIFVAIHGYLNPKDWRISIYGTFMTLCMAGLGYMYQYWGLISAIAAHFMIDVWLMYFLALRPQQQEENPANDMQSEE
jgi:hypothetical protein